MRTVSPILILLGILTLGCLAIAAWLYIDVFFGSDVRDPIDQNPIISNIDEWPDVSTTTPSAVLATSSPITTPGQVTVFDPERMKTGGKPVGDEDAYWSIADEESYALLYSSEENFVQVSLTEPPLGEARLSAEKKLMEVSGLTEEELCNANVSVRAPMRLDEKQREFGLSFCPNAIDLQWE